MEDCIFCKIIKGEIPCYKIYEDNKCLAFLDIAKDVDGHILVIPKQHYKNILDCDKEYLEHTMAVVQKISNHLVDNCGYDGVNLLNCSNECAGQTVFHLHIHIVPRRNNDKVNCWPKFEGAKIDLDEMVKKLTLIK